MLLATDLDGTFLGGRQSDRMRLYRFLPRQPEVTLVFVTGRGFEHVLPLIYDRLLHTSEAADALPRVDLSGCRIHQENTTTIYLATL